MAQGGKILRQYNKNSSLETASLKYGQVEDRTNDALWDRIMEGTKIPSTWIVHWSSLPLVLGTFWRDSKCPNPFEKRVFPSWHG